MREKILELLEKDSRLTPRDISVMLGEKEADVEEYISDMVSKHVICGFNTLVNWEKTDKDFVTALIEVKVTPQRDQGFDAIARRIYMFEEVKAVYLMSGDFDLTVMVEGNNIKDVAYFVSNKLSLLDSVISTSTHFILKKYKDHGIVLDMDKKNDDRMIVSP